MTQIVPTVGRKVWYRPSQVDRGGAGVAGMVTHGNEPLDATVVAVHGGRYVNLAIFDALGHPHRRESVYLVQDGEDLPDAPYAEWMPYQINSAAAAANAPDAPAPDGDAPDGDAPENEDQSAPESVEV